MRKLAINSSDAFILVYSVDDPQSFNDLEQLRQSILNEREQAYLEQVSASSSAASSSILHSDCCLDSNASNASSMTTSSGFISCASGASSVVAATGQQLNPAQQQQQQQQQPQSDLSVSPSSRHWSLASLFSGHHGGNNHGTYQNQYTGSSAMAPSSVGFNNQTSLTHIEPLSNHYGAVATNNNNRYPSTCSSICSSSNSCSTSADNSRRSSISAAEAALRTRRTRHPPMVIVANKYDLPKEKHLVNSDEIEALVVIDWNNGFVRASAKQNWCIDEIFQQVLRQARQPPSLTEAIASKRRKSLPPKLPT